MREVVEDKFREEAWLQKQRNIVAGIGASDRGARCSVDSLEVDQQLEREPLLEGSKPERIVTLVLESESTEVVPETAPLPTSTPNPTPTLATQGRRTNPLTSRGHHFGQKLSGAPSIAEDVPDLIQT